MFTHREKFPMKLIFRPVCGLIALVSSLQPFRRDCGSWSLAPRYGMFALLLCGAWNAAWAQGAGGNAPGAEAAPQILITHQVDEMQRTVLKGNTHPLARAAFDHGAAPAASRWAHDSGVGAQRRTGIRATHVLDTNRRRVSRTTTSGSRRSSLASSSGLRTAILKP